MSILYNEGRVVGYSAYELYVKQYKAAHPGDEYQPLSEPQWLASSIGSGSAVLLNTAGEEWTLLPYGNYTYSYLDIELPEGCTLTSANTVYASLFIGTGVYDEGSHFAKAVSSYGSLLPNDISHCPSSTNPSEPYLGDPASGANISGYARIVDGIIYQPGTWTDASIQDSNQSPQKILQPDFTQKAHIRLLRAYGSTTQMSVEILITGFVDSELISPQPPTSEMGNLANGAFLGPESFPWASKIIILQNRFTAEKISRDASIDALDEKTSYQDYISPITGSNDVAFKALKLNLAHDFYALAAPQRDNMSDNWPHRSDPSIEYIDPRKILLGLANGYMIDLLGDGLRNCKRDNFKTGVTSINTNDGLKVFKYLQIGENNDVNSIRIYLSAVNNVSDTDWQTALSGPPSFSGTVLGIGW